MCVFRSKLGLRTKKSPSPSSVGLNPQVTLFKSNSACIIILLDAFIERVLGGLVWMGFINSLPPSPPQEFCGHLTANSILGMIILSLAVKIASWILLFDLQYDQSFSFVILLFSDFFPLLVYSKWP